MADSWSSDDEDRITGLRSAEKTRRRRGKKIVSSYCVVRYKVPGKITVPGRIMTFYFKEIVDELSSVYHAHGVDKLLHYIRQRFERSRRDTAVVTHSRGEDREVCRTLWSYHCAYLLTQDKRCTIKINNLLKNIHKLNVNYADAVISQIQNFVFYYTMDDNNYSKAHKHLQASLLVLQNVAPGVCTADVYYNLAVMYEQLAYLMPHRKTSHLHSALHLYSVVREHYRCEGEMTGDWELINRQISRIKLSMINIKLNMPNILSDSTSGYGRLYYSSLVEDSGRRCTVTGGELSVAEYMWDHITRPIDIDAVDINYLACVIYLYLRKSQIKKQGREYTLALEACVTAMSWYNDLYDDLHNSITEQIGRVLMELFQEIQEKQEATAAGAGSDLLHQEEEEVVHSAECYIDERVLCYTRTEEDVDTAMVYSKHSDTSFDLSSESDENIRHKQVEESKPPFVQTTSSSLKKDFLITEESCSLESIADSGECSVTESPYSNAGISIEDAVLEQEIDIDWPTVSLFLYNMGYAIDRSDDKSVCTDSDNVDPPVTECIDFSVLNQLLLDMFSDDEIQESKGKKEEITADRNTEHVISNADCQSGDRVIKHDAFLKEVEDNGSETTAQASPIKVTKFSSKTCTGSLFDNYSDNSETNLILTGEQSATGDNREDTTVSCQANDEDNKVSPVTRQEKHDTESSGCESEYHSAQENISTSGGQFTFTDASAQQEHNTSDNGPPVNHVGSDEKPPALHEVKYDPSVDDVTDSSSLDESSPNDDSQDTEVMDGY